MEFALALETLALNQIGQTMDQTLGSLREFPLFSSAILLLTLAPIGSLARTQQTQVWLDVLL